MDRSHYEWYQISLRYTLVVSLSVVFTHSKQEAGFGQIERRDHFLSPLYFFFRESKKSLLEEGNIMASLKHERVVKLLGVIMEDKDCSLVMELLPRGNLLVMLQTVSGSTNFSCLWLESIQQFIPVVCILWSVILQFLNKLSGEQANLFLFLGLCATLHQGQDHFRDSGSNGVPLRETHHTQGPEARKHFSGQGLSHQGTSLIRAHEPSMFLPAQWR